MNIKKFNQFISESVSLDMNPDWSQMIKDTPELSNLVSKRKLELKGGKINFDRNDQNTVEILQTYLGISIPEEK